MKILEQDFEYKYSNRAMLIFEELTGKAFEVKTLLDSYVFAFSCLLANKNNPSLDFNEFIDYCDEHPEVMESFGTYMNAELKRRDSFPKKKVMENL